MSFSIEPLPYPTDALAPAISPRTVEIHYQQHHRGYLEKLQKLATGRDADRSLEELIEIAEGDLYNNAAQVWNHSFYWNSMKPGGGGDPSGMLADLVTEAFGSADAFRREFAEAANGEFGSGWAWLVRDRYGRFRIQKSSDAENPLKNGYVPLLTIDVWEHAYYLDYQNRRDRYVENYLDHLINWEWVVQQLKLPSKEQLEARDREDEEDADR